MSLVWKLLRHHVSVPQLAGFALANLVGMFIVLLGFQFYSDVLPVFTQGDSFMGANYLVVSKRIGTGTTLSGRGGTFDAGEQAELAGQPFATKVGAFTSTEYKADARMGVQGVPVLSSELFFESVPDGFVDVPLEQWTWTDGSREVPIILPRTYINMYNFGFAQSHSLPKISEGLAGMIDFGIFIQGAGRRDEYKGRVIGFSGRLSSILVPQSFMDWSNERYAPGRKAEPTRLVVEVGNPTDTGIAKYMEERGLEVQDDKLNAEKTTYFLRLVVTLVMGVGVIIAALSFYVLMLSVYLLVQKNASKLQNLLLIGYSPQRVARPYQWLTVGLNLAVLLLVWLVLYCVRDCYMGFMEELYPGLDDGSFLPAVALGLALFAVVTAFNMVAIRQKVVNIWKNKEK